jgi:hypothetical protein
VPTKLDQEAWENSSLTASDKPGAVHTAYRWLCQGRLRGKQATRGGQHIWLVTMAAGELDQIRAAPLRPARTRNPA